MKTSRKLIYFLQSAISGIWIPVLSLTFLEKGCTYQTLALALAFYSATTIIFEVPSGIFADRHGRKFVFLLSCAFFAVHIILLMLADNALMLFPSLFFYGIGKAFSSGSLDALFLEEYTEIHGSESLSTVTGQLIFYQLSGLIAGSFMGGLLPSSYQYGIHSVIRLILLAFNFLLCAALVSEKAPGRDDKSSGLSSYLRQSASIIKKTPFILSIFICALGFGLVFSMLETYWQPAFMDLAVLWQKKLLGFVSASGFLSVMAGNWLIQKRITNTRQKMRDYLLLQALIFGLVIVFSMQKHVSGFLLLYIMVYFFQGGSNHLEQTLLNSLIPNSQRAGLLSVLSLFAQIGGVLACCFAGVTVAVLGIHGLWVTACCLGLLMTGIAALLPRS